MNLKMDTVAEFPFTFLRSFLETLCQNTFKVTVLKTQDQFTLVRSIKFRFNIKLVSIVTRLYFIDFLDFKSCKWQKLAYIIYQLVSGHELFAAEMFCFRLIHLSRTHPFSIPPTPHPQCCQGVEKECIWNEWVNSKFCIHFCQGNYLRQSEVCKTAVWGRD